MNKIEQTRRALSRIRDEDLRDLFPRLRRPRRLYSHVGLAFVDAWKLKNLCFQLIHEDYAIAVVDIVEGDVVRFLCIPALESHRQAIEKLAMRYYCKLHWPKTGWKVDNCQDFQYRKPEGTKQK